MTSDLTDLGDGLRQNKKNRSEKLVEEVVDYDQDIAPYRIVCLIAGVGSGKTRYFMDTMTGNAQKNIPHKITAVIESRKSKVEELQTRYDLQEVDSGSDLFRPRSIWESTAYYDDPDTAAFHTIQLNHTDSEWGEFAYDKVYQHSSVCTSAYWSNSVLYNYDYNDYTTDPIYRYDLIVVDEAHSLVTDATYQTAPFGIYAFIEHYHDAWVAYDENPEQNRKPRCSNLVLITGSPEPLELLPLPAETKIIDLREQCKNVVPANIFFIDSSEARARILAQYNAGEKFLYFSNHKPVLSQLFPEMTTGELAKLEQVTAVGFSESQKSTWDELEKTSPVLYDNSQRTKQKLAAHSMIPEDIQMFFTTSCNKEGINIENVDIDDVYVETKNFTDIIQMAGRVRHGVDRLFIIVDVPGYYDDELRWMANFNERILPKVNEQFQKICEPISWAKKLKKAEREKHSDHNFEQTDKDIRTFIDFVQTRLPYILFNSYESAFQFYELRRLGRRYQRETEQKFKQALEIGKLVELAERYFPNSTVHDYAPFKKQRLAKAQAYMDTWYRGPDADYSQSEKEELQRTLNEIMGTTYTQVNKLLKPLGYVCKDRSHKKKSKDKPRTFMITRI